MGGSPTLWCPPPKTTTFLTSPLTFQTRKVNTIQNLDSSSLILDAEHHYVYPTDLIPHSAQPIFLTFITPAVLMTNNDLCAKTLNLLLESFAMVKTMLTTEPLKILPWTSKLFQVYKKTNCL